MFRIAICDDMPDHLEKIYKLTNEYININKLTAEIVTFPHPDNLLSYLVTQNAQLYILDVVMPMMSGVQLGQEIRKLDREAQIIFATTAPEYALESFSVNPLNYLIKPIEKDKLFATLAIAIAKMEEDEKTITIKCKTGIHTISIFNIVCCEYVNHAIKYILSSGDTIVTTTLKGNFSENISPLLADKRFIKPHSSFIVNMRRVERLTHDGFTMNGGVFVPVTAKLFSEVKSAYMDYRLRDEVIV